jgi:hypothetical protein
VKKMSFSYWPIKKRRRRRTDWDQIHRLATAGGRTLRELSDEYHIAYGTLLNRSYPEGWMIGRIQSNRSAAKARSQASQECAGISATSNQATNQQANGILISAASPRPAVSSDLSDLLNLVTPENAASFILAAIKVLGQEARTYTGRSLAYGLSHDDFLALSRIVSALSAKGTAFGYRPPTSGQRYNPNCY